MEFCELTQFSMYLLSKLWLKQLCDTVVAMDYDLLLLLISVDCILLFLTV